MAQTKIRQHNEYFRSVSLGGRKSCPTCYTPLEAGESVWSWGEYLYGKWRTVKHFCKTCAQQAVVQPLTQHAGPCGCVIGLKMYRGEQRPGWLPERM